MNLVFFYLLYYILCSIIIILRTVDISNMLLLTVDYNGLPGFSFSGYVISLCSRCQAVSLRGELLCVIISKSFLCLYLRSLERYFQCFAHIIPFSCSSSRRRFSCCMPGFGDLAVSPCSLCMLSLLSYHTPSATPLHCRLELESLEQDFPELSCVL